MKSKKGRGEVADGQRWGDILCGQKKGWCQWLQAVRVAAYSGFYGNHLGL